MEIFVATDLTLHELAQQLREILNIPDRNRSPNWLDPSQWRYSDNLGGEYYLFEVFGLLLKLIRNEGEEAGIPERSEYSYYILVDTAGQTDLEMLACLRRYLCGVLRRAGLKAAVEEDLPPPD